MGFQYPPRVYILIGVLGAMTLAYSVSHLAAANEYEDPYPFRTQFARLAPLQPLLAGKQKVAYLSDIKPGDSAYTRLYFPTQYVLAPTLLVPIEDAGNMEFAVGNFTRREDYAALGRPLGLEAVKEFPMGVVLYRRQPATSAAAVNQISAPQ